MPIAINGSGTVTGISVGGLPDGIVDTDMIANAAVTEPKRGADAVLQFVINNGNGQATTNSSSFTNVANAQISITTKRSGSKILVQFRGGTANNGAINGIHWQISRDKPSTDTIIYNSGQDSHWETSAWTGVGTTFLSYYDTHGQSVGTEITYKIRWKVETSATAYINTGNTNGAIQMFAWEIA
jgi:hypothetical protein